jgi:uncharacterized integral membrane protein
MSSKDDKKTEDTVDKPKMMKGGLKDRPLMSWIRILLLTSTWWTRTCSASRSTSSITLYLKPLKKIVNIMCNEPCAAIRFRDNVL